MSSRGCCAAPEHAQCSNDTTTFIYIYKIIIVLRYYNNTNYNVQLLYIIITAVLQVWCEDSLLLAYRCKYFVFVVVVVVFVVRIRGLFSVTQSAPTPTIILLYIGTRRVGFYFYCRAHKHSNKTIKSAFLLSRRRILHSVHYVYIIRVHNNKCPMYIIITIYNILIQHNNIV